MSVKTLTEKLFLLILNLFKQQNVKTEYFRFALTYCFNSLRIEQDIIELIEQKSLMLLSLSKLVKF